LYDDVQAGRCTFVEEEAYDEHDREIAEIYGPAAPETPPAIA
jgi:hypothetical protein